MDFNTGTMTLSQHYTLQISRYYSTRKVFSSQPDFQLNWTTLNNSDASIPLLPSSYRDRLASRNSTDSQLPFLLNHLRLPSKEIFDFSLSCVRSSLYSLGAASTENSLSYKFLYCYRGVFTSPLHRNDSSPTVACVFISAGTCCLAMNVYSGLHVTIGRHKHFCKWYNKLHGDETFIIAQQVKKFVTFYRQRISTTVFKTARHRNLSWAITGLDDL
jgi:hypothetical protein